MLASKLQSVLEANNVQAWDGSRLRALLALIAEYLPLILPLFLKETGLQSVDDAKLMAAPERELEARDWKAIIALILQLLAMFIPAPTPEPTPTPTPTPGPVA